MASKLSYDIELNTQGYVQGARQAANSTKDLETATRDYLKEFGPLTKQLRAAKQEARNLAGQFIQLSKTERESEIGQHMAEELNLAIKKAAELTDAMNDVDAAIKRESSDTAGWDALSDTFEIGKNLATAYAGAVTKLTGDEKALKDVIANLAMIQGAFNAVIKTTNALQKDSQIMLTLQRTGILSVTQATNIATKATQVQTIAIRGLSAAIKTVPYLAAAAAVAALVVGIVKWTSKTDEAIERQKKLGEEMHVTSIQGQKDAQAEATKLNVLYNATQDVNIKMEDRLKAVEEIQNKYPSYFGNLSKEAILAGEAADKYKELKDDIIACAMARAYEKKISDIAEQNVDLEDQIEKQKEIVKQTKRAAEEAKKAQTGQTYGTANVNMSGMNASHAADVAKKEQKALEDLEDQQKANTAQQQKYLDKINETLPAQNRLKENAEAVAKANKGGNGGKSGAQSKKEELTVLQALNAEVAKYQKQLENIKDPFSVEGQQEVKDIRAKLDDAKKTLKDYKIAVGLEIEKPTDKLKELEQKVKDAQIAYRFAVENNDEAARQAAQEAYYAAQKELKDYKLSITIEPQMDIAKIQEEKDKVQNLVNEALTPSVKEFDFSLLPEDVQDKANLLLDQYKRIEDARKDLEKTMNESTDDEVIAAAQNGLDKLSAKYDEIGSKLETFNSANEILDNQEKKWESLSKTIGTAGQAMGALGGLFNAIAGSGEDEDPTAKAMGIVFETLANLALSFANALKSCHTWVEWLIFSVTGMAQLISMTQQINQLTKEKHAGGGIVGGSSFVGDKILAGLNSGEMVMNGNQQQRLWNILNGTNPAPYGNNKVEFTGIIRGKDMLLVEKNYNKIGSKSGQNIKIN